MVNILGGILVKRYHPSSDVPIDLSQIITQLLDKIKISMDAIPHLYFANLGCSLLTLVV